MAMPSAPADRYWLPDDIWAFPDDGVRRECIDGMLLVTPSPSGEHQDVVREFLLDLGIWLRAHPAAIVRASPSDVRLTHDSVVQPDVYVFADRAALKDGKVLLAIEVLSPGTARFDRGLKRRFYQRQRVGEYWIVDLEAQLVERWRPEDERPEVLGETLTWQPPGADGPLTIDLPTLFGRAALGT